MMKIETARKWYKQASAIFLLYPNNYKEEKNESTG